jgi:hypothetical protein
MMRLTKRIARWSAGLALAALLGGCASPVTVTDYATPVTACCSSVSEFKFRPLPLGQDVELSFTAEDSTYAFAGRRQHFIALKVPDGFSATTIHVRSYLKGSFLPTASAVIPDFYYFDANLKMIGKESSGDFQSAGGFWRSAVSGRARVAGGARYIMVVAGDGSNGVPVVQSGNGISHRIPAAPLGDFAVRLFGEPLGK